MDTNVGGQEILEEKMKITTERGQTNKEKNIAEQRGKNNGTGGLTVACQRNNPRAGVDDLNILLDVDEDSRYSQKELNVS